MACTSDNCVELGVWAMALSDVAEPGLVLAVGLVRLLGELQGLWCAVGGCPFPDFWSTRSSSVKNRAFYWAKVARLSNKSACLVVSLNCTGGQVTFLNLLTSQLSPFSCPPPNLPPISLSLVRFEPRADPRVAHHMLLFGCSAPAHTDVNSWWVTGRRR